MTTVMPNSAHTQIDAHLRYRAARDLLLDCRGDRLRAGALFEWPDLGATFNWAHDWFDVVARENDRPALRIALPSGEVESYSFRELAVRSNQVARLLARAGVRRGDAVMIVLGNQVELWESMLGAMKLGAVLMPTTTAVTPTDLTDRMSRSGARAVIADEASAAKFDGLDLNFVGIVVGEERAGWTAFADSFEESAGSVPHPLTGCDDRLLLYFTSGTTSRPKMVEHTQVSYPVGHLTTMYWLGLRPGDVHLNISSPGWAKHAWSCFFAPWTAEATVQVLAYAKFDAAALLEVLRRDQVTSICAPPTVWRMLIRADLGERPRELREGIAAGEPLNPEVIEQIDRAWGIGLRDGFGQTETTALVGNCPGEAVRPGSMGRPLPGVPVVLVDPVSGTRRDDEGELCLDLSAAPLNLMTRYADDPERDREARAGGVYHTGDLVSRDEDGYLTYVGRSDDVFKASDYKISPFELESALVEHPAVLEAAVVPAPDSIRLAVPKAYVALAPGWQPDEVTATAILAHARDVLPPYLRVRRLEFAELPKTISGKIRRVELRAREENDPAGAAAREYRDDLLDRS